jgi:hypothetical protein
MIIINNYANANNDDDTYLTSEDGQGRWARFKC